MAMKENSMIEKMLNRYPELKEPYDQECKILTAVNRKISPYLFFEYVLADALKTAIATKNHSLIKGVVHDMETLCKEDYGYYSDIVITAVFEHFTPEEICENFAEYFGICLKRAYAQYTEA